MLMGDSKFISSIMYRESFFFFFKKKNKRCYYRRQTSEIIGAEKMGYRKMGFLGIHGNSYYGEPSYCTTVSIKR